MHSVSGDGFPNVGMPPLPVMNAVPVTTNPAGDYRVELRAQAHPIGADHTVRHENVVCVGARVVGSSLFTVPCVIPKSDVSIFMAA